MPTPFTAKQHLPKRLIKHGQSIARNFQAVVLGVTIVIEVKPSPTADTRTCDVSKVEKKTLLDSSRCHIADVGAGLGFFVAKMTEAASVHDYDKLSDIDWFYSDFKTKFEQTGWWDNHRKIHRHHLDHADGVPEDVNLIDVLEHIADCVMAGMARSGEVYKLQLSDELLQKAFANTAELLKENVRVVKQVPCPRCLEARAFHGGNVDCVDCDNTGSVDAVST